MPRRRAAARRPPARGRQRGSLIFVSPDPKGIWLMAKHTKTGLVGVAAVGLSLFTLLGLSGAAGNAGSAENETTAQREAEAEAEPAAERERPAARSERDDPAESAAEPAAGTEEAAGDAAAAASPEQMEKVEKMLGGWPEASQKAARMMMEKYGPPAGVTDMMLVWRDESPWEKIVVYKDEVVHRFPMKHTDVLEQVIMYKVPPDKFDELAQFDGSVIAERTKGTLAARCDKEPMNFLALNLAHDVATGGKTVEEARQFYAKTAMAFMKGEKHPYTQRLQFEPPRKAGDPDEPAMKK